MEPFNQLSCPYSLRKLTLSVSFWRNTIYAEGNGELEWALQTLRDLPADHTRLEQVIINIRVGAQSKKEWLAFVDFQRYRGWNSWDNELNESKWQGVKYFVFIVCCDCGPKIFKGTDDIQTVIARQMPLLRRSRKLSVGHAVLGDEGLTDYDIFKWTHDGQRLSWKQLSKDVL